MTDNWRLDAVRRQIAPRARARRKSRKAACLFFPRACARGYFSRTDSPPFDKRDFGLHLSFPPQIPVIPAQAGIQPYLFYPSCALPTEASSKRRNPKQLTIDCADFTDSKKTNEFTG
ncbi:MAG TPA: hypothetical protein PKY88_11310 [Anaerohalosphaeraceae bacterium]|nr:hypothetical protein [Anaerohalosphaeraceae bacterium]